MLKLDDERGGSVRVEWNQGAPLLTLWGELNEESQLSELVSQLKHRDGFQKRIVIDLERLEFVNSAGVRAWIRLVTTLQNDGIRARVQRCPEVMVRQMNMISSARGRLEFESFYAPYFCGGCGHEKFVLQRSEELSARGFPRVHCERCQAEMGLDDEPTSYTQFLGSR